VPAPIDPRVNHRLSDPEVAALKAYGEVRRHEAGEVLIEAGAREFDLCVVLSGQLDLFLDDREGEQRVAWLEPRQFTGDVTNLTGGRSRASARMVAAGEVLHVSFAALQRILVENSKLSDLFVEVFLARRAWQIATGRASVLLIGRAFDRDSFAVRDLLTRHNVPHLWIDVDADEAGDLILEKRGLTRADLPCLVTGSKSQLVRPSLAEVGAELGLDLLPDGACADLLVVGAGPAGLAASVYAASEGLSVVTIDSVAPGGQAGLSSKIENYLGFPTGVSGGELAQRATVQAQKFGTRIASPATAASLEKVESDYRVRLADGRALLSRAVVLAGGAHYRRPPIPNLEHYEGRGVYYGATAMEAQICKGSKATIVGAGNSAGQGAVFLAASAEEVHVVYRRANIRDTMSEYLVRRLEETANIHLHPSTEIAGLVGDENRLEALIARSAAEGDVRLATPFVFLFTGAEPHTAWLPAAVARDDKGFLKTGGDIANIELVRAAWMLERMPSFYETSWARVYAVGDIRAGSVKRVASGVGEGSVVVQYIHRALAEGA
jgi:thioredoxin reductase (NADPH)